MAGNKVFVSCFILFGNYISDKPKTYGLPSFSYFVDELHLSANYFGYLIKKERCASVLKYVQTKLIDVAKTKMFDVDKSISQNSLRTWV